LKPKDFEFRIYGEGALKDWMIAEKKKYKLPIVFAYVENQELISHILGATIFVHPSIWNEQINIPLSVNPLWIRLLIEKEITIKNVEDIKEDDMTIYCTLKSQNIKSMYLKLILDYDKLPLGFISVINYNEVNELDDEKLQLLNETSIAIAGLIKKKII